MTESEVQAIMGGQGEDVDGVQTPSWHEVFGVRSTYRKDWVFKDIRIAVVFNRTGRVLAKSIHEDERTFLERVEQFFRDRLGW